MIFKLAGTVCITHHQVAYYSCFEFVESNLHQIYAIRLNLCIITKK